MLLKEIADKFNAAVSDTTLRATVSRNYGKRLTLNRVPSQAQRLLLASMFISAGKTPEHNAVARIWRAR